MGQIAWAYGAFKVPPHNTFFLNIVYEFFASI